MGAVQSKRLQGRKTKCGTSSNSSNSSNSNVDRRIQKLSADSNIPVHFSRQQNAGAMFSGSQKSPAAARVSPRRNIYSSNSLPRNMPMRRLLDNSSDSLTLGKKHSSSMLQTRSTVPVRRAESYVGVESTSRFLPDDWDSQDSDLALHFALKRLLGGNILPSVHELLKPNATVVDLGCLNGAWLMDMAPQYRNCQFIGIEASAESLVIPQLLSIPNVRLEVASPTAPFVPLPDASVDVCCLRAQSLHFQLDDWDHMLSEAFRILKPGGVLQVVEAYYAMEGTVLIESFFHTGKL
ncbi:S-adenosyl-L-methionine-dependent methyltransferase [Dichotomocladium elegans]|nr:S-adenosyl-L-methionine-dependent methyltransferase [Dichotomocladium elegans]